MVAFDNTAIEYMVAHLLPHYPFSAADLNDESQVLAARSRRRESHPPADHDSANSGPLVAADGSSYGDDSETASETYTAERKPRTTVFDHRHAHCR